jgi:tRNA 2-thiouridine synthesizing protein C
MSKANIKTTIIIKSPPFGLIDGKEGVDLALVCAAFEFEVCLIFIDQGIFHLIDKQDETNFSDKLHDKQLKALEFYDIEQVYAESESLIRFSIDHYNLLKNTLTISTAEINSLVTTSNNTVIF